MNFKTVEDTVDVHRERTLLYSCLLSGWAPITTGYAAFIGKSVLLFSDFFRRTGELIGLILAWYTARLINKRKITDNRQILTMECRSSLIVAVIMLFSSLIVGTAAVRSFMNPQETTNIILGLFIACSGFLVNGYFFLRYKKLNKLKPGHILSSQKRLYYTKMFTDFAIALTLVLTKVLPAPYNLLIDPLGSAGITILLLISGISTLKDSVSPLKQNN